jgi:CO dehydrogenase/acetyl-CoA synthase alpha subunit
MTDLIERIRQTISDHREDHRDNAVGIACRCGAEGLSDHSRHVAEQVVERLGLRPELLGDVRKEIRYVSARFDDELTKLEGAE